MLFKRIAPLFLPGLLLAAALLFAACSDDDNKAAPAGAADSTGGNSSVAAPITPHVQLPADYPEDFPAYPNATLQQSGRYADQAIAVFQTSDSRQAVTDFYRDALAKPPWKLLEISDEASQNLSLVNFQHTEQPIHGSVTVVATSGANPSTAISLLFTLPKSVGPALPTAPPLPTDQPTPAGSSGG